jgi:hypothetical protein
MSSEVKPIVVIYIPENFDIGGRMDAANRLMSVLNNDFGREPTDRKYQSNNYWKDYLWFVFYDYEVSTPQFKVFFPKDFTEIQYGELKKLIEDSLQQIENKIQP